MNTAIVITFLTRCLYFVRIIFLNPHSNPNLHHRYKTQDMDRWDNPPEIIPVLETRGPTPGARVVPTGGAALALVAVVRPPAR